MENKQMSAIYDNLEFKTRLQARWAAFFDMVGWEWKANPSPVDDWSPDFRVTFPCAHSECSGSHTLLIAVLPITKIEDFNNHPCLTYAYGQKDGKSIPADAGAAFGVSPSVTRWEFAHGSGGGVEDVYSWVEQADVFWEKATTLVP